MRSSEAAERLGVTPSTIKYYEELGLLSPRRSSSNYREYVDDDLERVERIRHLRQLGFSLSAIREFLKYRRQVDETGRRRLRTADVEAAVTALETRLAQVRTRVAEARLELEEGERLAAELDSDIARARGYLASRQASTGAVERK